MFQSFASYQPFQNGNNPNKATASNTAMPTSSLAAPSDQPQNTGGPLTSSLLNTANTAATKEASNLMGGSSADARAQLMQSLAKNGNPIAQSALAPNGGTMTQADPSQADGAKGWFDGLLNTFASNSPSSTAAPTSSIAPAAAGGSAVPAAGGDAAASGAASSGAADSSAGSFLDWL